MFKKGFVLISLSLNIVLEYNIGVMGGLDKDYN